MGKLTTSRISKINYYLNIAGEVAKRSTCIRRKYGAIIVKNDEIISTGYNGSPRCTTNCSDAGICMRAKLNIPSGERYELCKSVHAEMNCIISAKRSDMIGSTLYLYGINMDNSIHTAKPCLMCEKLIINSGIANVIGIVNPHELKELDDSIIEHKGVYYKIYNMGSLINDIEKMEANL